VKPTESFNLLVTFKGRKTEDTGEELLGIEEIELALQNEENLFTIKETVFYNVVLVQSDSDPLKITKILAESPTTVISKIVPLEVVVRTQEDLITEKVIKLSREKIKSGETFIVRGDLRGRGHIESKEELLTSITQKITEELQIEMDVNEPDWVVQIEVVGENTGISVLNPDDIVKKV
jgi:tRNA acetyltransferase TAN1